MNYFLIYFLLRCIDLVGFLLLPIKCAICLSNSFFFSRSFEYFNAAVKQIKLIHQDMRLETILSHNQNYKFYVYERDAIRMELKRTK